MAGKNPSHLSVSDSSGNSSSASKRPNIATTIGACLIGTAMLVVLAVADGQMFEDPEFSGLYKFTLDQAFSRFKESDRKVPAGPQGAPTRPSQPGRTREQMQRLANFGKSQGGLGSLPQAGRGAAGRQQPAAGQHAHDQGGPNTKRGNDFARTGNHAEAVKAYQLALQEDPTRLQARHSMGDSLRAMGRHDEAIAAYRAVLKQNPQYYCCYTHIGDVEKSRNNTSVADSAYTKAIDGYQQQVQSGGPAASTAKFQLAKLYHDLNRNLPEALKFAEEANAATPNTFAYLQILAQIYEKLGRTKDASVKYDELIKVAPQHAQYFQQQKQRLTAAAGKPSTN
ncbi:MAG: tetratricopeptide repeat protein [Planctomycetes bacterium]|nr:tetratricopeptide repeat protein [Planctomycetota bacterium]